MTDTQEAMREELMEYCTRSHPHENMDRECRLLTIIAKLRNESVHTATTIAAKDAEIERLKAELEAIKNYESPVKSYKIAAWQCDYARKQLAAAELSNKQLREFAIWLTGCGYDFTVHEYFLEMRKLLAQRPSTEALDAYVAKLTKWQPIETAPKDDGFYLVLNKNCVVKHCHIPIVMRFLKATQSWYSHELSVMYDGVTHWMPLPPAPDKE